MIKMMRLCFLYVLLVFAVFDSRAWGLTITEPKPNSVYHPSDKVVVKVQPAPSENVKEVLFMTSFTKEFNIVSSPPFDFNFTLGDYIGTEKISASAKMIDGSIVDAEVEIKVVLPKDVTLKRIQAPDHVFLSKLPKGSDPNRIKVFETKNLSVSGIYSNGYELDLHSASDGTVYASSDEKIVSVDSEGKLTAQGVGTATVTIKNGTFMATTKVIVNAKSR